MAISVIDTIKPKNNGSFPIVEAADVVMPDGTRLGDAAMLPATTEADEGKIPQVVDGALVLVDVADSAIAAYIEDYINSALEGEY